MGRNTTVIPISAMLHLIKEQGRLRASKKAGVLLEQHAEQYAKEIAERACDIAEHAGRTTLLGADIKLAAKHHNDF